MTHRPIRIGSRGSPLALWQARWVQDRLRRLFPDRDFPVEVIKTKGDKILDSPLSTIGDKGLFTREIEYALLNKEIDLAVHSLKDLPTELPKGLALGAVTQREDVRDVFIPHPRNPVKSLLDQPHGATVATGSLRRRSQLLNARPDLRMVDLRGNLNTRMQKLEASEWSGMILARAGVMRLGWEQAIGETLDLALMLPAVGQGALGVEIREDDQAVRELLAPLHSEESFSSTRAERSLLRRLEGGCQIPIGAYAYITAQTETSSLYLDAMVGTLDGTRVVRGQASGLPRDAETIGTSLGDTLLKQGAEEILAQIRIQ